MDDVSGENKHGVCRGGEREGDQDEARRKKKGVNR